MKALNIFGIILAWILSIVMVLMLVAAPLTLSALSLLDPENIAELVGDALVKQDASAAAQPTHTLRRISAETATLGELSAEADENSAAENILSGMNLDAIQDIVGEQVDEAVLGKILESEMVGELLDAYVSDVTNAITGKSAESQFTAEKLVKVVKDNMGEIVAIVEESGVTLSEEQKSQLKTEIQTAVEENAEQIIAELPTPEQLKENLVGNNKEIEIAMGVLAAKNQIKGMLVGAIVLVSLLIFGLRYPGLRGMRWLSANLFTAGGINVVICIALGLGTSAVKGVVAGVNAIDGTAFDDIVGTLLSQLTTGVVIRTVIIFVAAIALLVGYILLKPVVRKKKAAPVAEAPAFEAGETPSYVPTAAPVYTSAPVEAEPAQQTEEA